MDIMSNLNDQLAEKTVSSRRWSSSTFHFPYHSLTTLTSRAKDQIVLISHLNYYTVASALPLPRGMLASALRCDTALR